MLVGHPKRTPLRFGWNCHTSLEETKVLSSLKLSFAPLCLKMGPPILHKQTPTDWGTIAKMNFMLEKNTGTVVESIERTGWGVPVSQPLAIFT